MFVSLGAGLFAFLYGNIERLVASKYPVKYVYYSNLDSVSSIVFIKSLRYKTAYLRDIEEYRRTRQDIAISYPLNFLEAGTKIYVRKYLNDSLVEFFDPTFQNKLFRFRTGYIHRIYVYDSSKQH